MTTCCGDRHGWRYPDRAFARCRSGRRCWRAAPVLARLRASTAEEFDSRFHRPAKYTASSRALVLGRRKRAADRRLSNSRWPPRARRLKSAEFVSTIPIARQRGADRFGARGHWDSRTPSERACDPRAASVSARSSCRCCWQTWRRATSRSMLGAQGRIGDAISLRERGTCDRRSDGNDSPRGGRRHAWRADPRRR